MIVNAQIGDREYVIDHEHNTKLDILSLSNYVYHIIHKNKSFKARIVSANYRTKMLRVEVNGSNYDVKLQDDLDVAIQKMGFKLATDKVDNIIIAPMPGLVLDVMVEKGQKVEKGQALLILEAMKMENVIKAEMNGVIKEISVVKGEAVEKKAILIELEL